MREFFYEVVTEDTADDLTTVSVVADDDELFQVSIPGIFRLDEPRSVEALEEAVLARLIQDGEANDDDVLTAMEAVEDS